MFTTLTDKHLVYFTNSKILKFLPFTDLALCSIGTLIHKHHLAPFTGEINSGVANGVINEVPATFAPLNSTRWSKDRSHDNDRAYHSISNVHELQNELMEEANGNFSTLLDLLCTLLRDYHLQVLPILPEKEKNEIKGILEQAKERVIKIFIFQTFAAKYLIQRPELIDPFLESEAIAKMREQYNRIPMDLLDKSSDEQFEIINKMASDFYIVKKNKLEKKEDKARAFQIINNEKIIQHLYYYLRTTLLWPSRNDFLQMVTRENLYDMHTENTFSGMVLEDINHVTNECKSAINVLSRNVDLIFDILDGKIPKQTSLYEKLKEEAAFPIAFFLENSDGLISVKDEFKSKKPLILGRDIKLIAVDKGNLINIIEFLWSHNLSTITVIDINYSFSNTSILYAPPTQFIPYYKANIEKKEKEPEIVLESTNAQAIASFKASSRGSSP